MTQDDDDTTAGPERSRNASRRDFLKRAGIAAAGIAVGGVAGGVIGATVASQHAEDAEHETGEEYPTLPPRSSPGYDHLVVLMYENRSFDNLLGYLYDESSLPAGKRFEGVAFGEYSNPDPAGGVIHVHPYEGTTDFIMHQPSPDPGEVYAHVNTQLYGVVDPPGNADRRLRDLQPPYNAPPAGAKPENKGFVRDYLGVLRRDGRDHEPQPDEYRRIMGSFTPDMLPVFSTLARSFAVYDDWHCAVPSQTFCNRSFFHASTSHGYVDNSGAGGLLKWFDPRNDAPTIFNRLEDAGLNWRVYFDDRQIVSLTGFIHAPALEPYWHSNFRTMTQFYDDVERGGLPDYAFVEPRLLYDHNDMHPPGGPMTEEDVDGTIIAGGGISDVRAGELLLHRMYSAVRSSKSPTGSNAMNTMFLVTFDEHGGTYDHVPPGPASPPDDSGPGEMGFSFDRLGVRVPAIAISAYTARNTIINEEMHHGAVISTLARKHGLEHLTDRDRDARTIDNAVNRATPRQPGTWPDTHPQYLPANPEAEAPSAGDDDRPLSPPGVGLIGLLTARYGKPGEPVPRTYREAFDQVERLGVGLFGTTE